MSEPRRQIISMRHTRSRKRRAASHTLKYRRYRRRTRRTAAKQSANEFITPVVTFLVGATICAFLFWQNPFLGNFETYRLINCGLLLFVPLVVILLFLRQSPVQFGLARGDRKVGLKWALIAWIAMLPVLAFAASRHSFIAYYGQSLAQVLGYAAPYPYSPFFKPHFYLAGLVYYELATAFYLFCWEFFFRGFLLFGLARARFIGAVGAILIQTIPFTLLHWSVVPGASKPPLEIASAFFGGIILGVLAWRTRSFVYGFLIHWAISVTLDLMLLAKVMSLL
jgi:membrane protease YdiL (CAAX protease family)